jgi:rhodanese-related sulfurtransferase|tara:strand:+ start:5930 stop:6313 length:384 start_codon:yes stop_codon:yes gene_type:complete
MKKIYLALTLLLSFDLVSAELWNVEQLKEAISELDHKPVLLDVRTQSEYNDGHIRDAINISHDQILKRPQLVAEYKDSQIVVFCRSGVRAGKVIEMLEGLGFKEIIDIDGDMLAWNEAGYSVESSSE